MTPAQFVVVEGLDGSGKSTLARHLHVAIVERARAKLIGFPSRDSAPGAVLRNLFEKRIQLAHSAILWTCLAEGVDRDHEIRSLVADGVWVVSDRHTQASGRVYQVEHHPEAVIEAALELADFAVPDRLFVIDVSIEVALERRRARNEARNEIFEPTEAEHDRLQAARQRYLNLQNHARFARCTTVLDGEMRPDQLLFAALRALGFEP